jgi:hypothetical protein
MFFYDFLIRFKVIRTRSMQLAAIEWCIKLYDHRLPPEFTDEIKAILGMDYNQATEMRDLGAERYFGVTGGQFVVRHDPARRKSG